MQKIFQALSDGAPFSYVNVVVFAVTLATIVDRVIFLLFKGQINSRGLLEQLQKLIKANNIDRAIRLTGSANAPLLRVAKAGLTQVHRGEEAISTAIEESLVDSTPDLKKRISSLWSLANIGTLIGLLGTVSGLIRAFDAVGSAAPEQRSAILAKGISEAMYNTALGLAIAVTCIIAHLLLGNTSKKMVADLESFSLKFENFLTQHARSGGAGAEAKPAAAR